MDPDTLTYTIIFILILLLSYNTRSKATIRLIFALYIALFISLFRTSDILLDLFMPASIAIIYFASIVILSIIRINYLIYLIIGLISFSFAIELFHFELYAQVFTDFAFYSIIIFVIRMISQYIYQHDK